MLRITVNDNPRLLTFRLEGRLEGPWVRELEQCWQSMLNSPNGTAIRVDLTGVTFVDGAGKARLAELYEQGAEFIAFDCATKAIVAEFAEGATEVNPSRKEPRHDAATCESNTSDGREGRIL